MNFDEENAKAMGKRIRARRISFGMTIAGLADRVGTHNTTILRYEKGEIKRANLPLLKAIADVLYVSLDWLLGKSGKEEKSKKQTDLSTIVQQIKALCDDQHIVTINGDFVSQEATEFFLSSLDEILDMTKKRNIKEILRKKLNARSCQKDMESTTPAA